MAFQDPDAFMAHTSQIAGETLVHYMNDPGARGIALEIVRRIYSAVCWTDLRVLYQYPKSSRNKEKIGGVYFVLFDFTYAHQPCCGESVLGQVR